MASRVWELLEIWPRSVVKLGEAEKSHFVLLASMYTASMWVPQVCLGDRDSVVGLAKRLVVARWALTLSRGPAALVCIYS